MYKVARNQQAPARENYQRGERGKYACVRPCDCSQAMTCSRKRYSSMPATNLRKPTLPTRCAGRGTVGRSLLARGDEAVAGKRRPRLLRSLRVRRHSNVVRLIRRRSPILRRRQRIPDDLRRDLLHRSRLTLYGATSSSTSEGRS